MRARDNPFAVHRVLTIRYRPQGPDWAHLMAHLRTLNYRAAIVGPEGSGKTTLLEDLGQRLAAGGWRIRSVSVTEEDGIVRIGPVNRGAFSSLDMVLLDGADLLSRIAWWRFRRSCRHAGGLIITSHRAGLLPTLLETSTTPQLLHDIVGDLLADAGRDVPADLMPLFHEHSGNIRDAIRALYDRYASLVQGHDELTTRSGHRYTETPARPVKREIVCP